VRVGKLNLVDLAGSER